MEIILYISLACTVIGVIALIFFVTYFFTAIGKNAHLLQITQQPLSVGSLEFLYTVASIAKNTPKFIDAQEIEIISKNDVFRRTLLEDIRSAKNKISIVTYVWAKDDETTHIFTELKNAVRRGVEVRLLIDAFGSSLEQEVIDGLKDAGVRVELFRPFQVGKISQYSVRTHRRSYVFDDCVAYIGGAAMTKSWLRKKTQDSFSYSDMMYRCRGNSVLAIISAFHELWISVTGEVIQLATVDTLNIPDPENPNFVSLVHTPQVDIHPFTYVLWYSLMCAREEIILCSPYFVPGRRIMDILVRKAQSGVSVKVLTQGTDELWFVRDTARQYYDELIEAGVEVYEYAQPHLHSKVSVIDSTWTLFGSANVDIRSQRINHENIFCIQDKTIAEKNLSVIENYFSRSKRITETHWQQWPWWRRVRARIIKNFSEQF